MNKEYNFRFRARNRQGTEEAKHSGLGESDPTTPGLGHASVRTCLTGVQSPGAMTGNNTEYAGINSVSL